MIAGTTRTLLSTVRVWMWEYLVMRPAILSTGSARYISDGGASIDDDSERSGRRAQHQSRVEVPAHIGIRLLKGFSFHCEV